MNMPMDDYSYNTHPMLSSTLMTNLKPIITESLDIMDTDLQYWYVFKIYFHHAVGFAGEIKKSVGLKIGKITRC